MAADSLTITTDKHRCSFVGLHAIDAVGRLILRAPAQSCLVTEIATGPGKGVPTMVEVTDVAAVALRDRVRARVTVHGSASLVHRGDCSGPLEEGLAELRVRLDAAELDEDGTVTVVDPLAFAAVEADPLCLAEPEMLLHLVSHHPEALARLSRLVDPALMLAVVRVSPYALDRYGIVLRLERLAGHRDVRLPFAERAADVVHAQRQLNDLVAAGARIRPCGQILRD
jgi:hypothetical protein